MEREAGRVGLRINEQKTKLMIVGGSESVVHNIGQNITIGECNFEVVNEFTYLSSLMTPQNDYGREIQKRIQLANRCFYGLRKQLRSNQLTKKTKFAIYKTLIRPVLVYGSETWVTTKKEENSLMVFERKILRTICGATFENGSYRRRYNFELDKMFNSPSLINVIKTNRLRYAGHMSRRDSDSPSKVLFGSRPEGRRKVGRPKGRWSDAVTSDAMVLGARNWTTLAQDRGKWKVLLDQALTKKKNLWL